MTEYEYGFEYWEKGQIHTQWCTSERSRDMKLIARKATNTPLLKKVKRKKK